MESSRLTIARVSLLCIAIAGELHAPITEWPRLVERWLGTIGVVSR